MSQQLYKEMILELYRNPQNKGVLDDFDIQQRGNNPSCGDDVVVYMKMNEDVVEKISHDGQGCAISQAALSLITDEVKGKSKSEIEHMSKERMLDLLGVPITYAREKCALLGLNTIQSALRK